LNDFERNTGGLFIYGKRKNLLALKYVLFEKPGLIDAGWGVDVGMR
jgi:hypothetical protein